MNFYNQHGFTMDRNKIIYRNYERPKKNVAVVSLDIANAFNECLWQKILMALHIRQVPDYLIVITRDYFDSRFINISFLNYNKIRLTEMGCPQGSACGPAFWNLAYDDVFRLTDSITDGTDEYFSRIHLIRKKFTHKTKQKKNNVWSLFNFI